jgi:hypothetical protein
VNDGRSGFRVSQLALGTMTFGTEWGWGADEAAARQLFDISTLAATSSTPPTSTRTALFSLLHPRHAAYIMNGRTRGKGPAIEFGDQRPALISGDLALTSTRCSNGSVTAEIARRQGDETWLWVIDQFTIA